MPPPYGTRLQNVRIDPDLWARFGELGVKLATETASPLTARASAMAALVGQPVA